MLPIIFKPNSNYKLIRLGKDNDGGYLVCENSILESDKLLSFGLADDWSFEEDYYKLLKTPIEIYDHTVNNVFWKRYLWNNLGKFLFRGIGFKNFCNLTNKYFSYKKFFKNSDINHFQKALGYGNLNDAISLDEIIIKNDKYNNLTLKIDIEGGEYRVLHDIIKYQNKIKNLIIEFHDVDLNLQKIVDFIKQFKLNLIHTHPNNANFVHKNIPAMIEMTFAANPIKIDDLLEYPHSLDQICEPSSEDIFLKFDDN